MTGRRIAIPRGWKWKDGKLVKSAKHLDVSTRLKQAASKLVGPVRRTAPR